MTKPDDYSQTYLRFLNLASAIRGLPKLDAVEQRVLDGLAATWATGTKVTVLEAMETSGGISPTTVHRRLKSLRAQGLIALEEDERDSRVKYVVATALAKDYFAKLGQALDRAARKSAH